MSSSTSGSALYVSEGRDLVHYALDVEAGMIGRRGRVSAPEEIYYVWPHPSSRWLYVVASDHHDPARQGEVEHHCLSAFSVGQDGALAPHGDPVSLPSRPIHVTMDAGGRYVITSYDKHSPTTVHRIGGDGRIGERVAQPHYLRAGIFPHQARMLPSDRRLIQVNRGNFPKGGIDDPGALISYSFEEGVLRMLDVAAPNGGFGFNPRHLDIHPGKPWIYVALEKQSELHMFSIGGECLSARPHFVKNMLAHPQNRRPRQLGGTLHVHPDGRAVYAVNRADAPVEHQGQKVFGGGENSIAVFAIDQATGEPSLIQHAGLPGIHVRCFALDPAGRILIAAARNAMNVLEQGSVRQRPRMLTLYRVAPDGRLTQVNNYEVDTGGRPQIWMGIVPLPA